MPSFDEDFEWQLKFRRHFGEIAREAMRVDVAPAEEDWNRNTDFILSTVIPLPKRDIRISARARRHKYASMYPHEFTVRLDRPSGVQSEMPKLRAGYGDFTIYGFEADEDSDRLGPWFIGNANLLRDYIARGGFYKVERNHDRSSRFCAFHLADMPLGFVLAGEGLRVWDDSRHWEQCRRCWWGNSKGGYVTATDEDRRPAAGYGRLCLACGFWWRSGWEMPLSRAA